MSGTPLSVRNPFLLRSFFSLPPSTSFFPCIESIRPCEPLSYRQPALERSTRGSFHFLPPSSSFPPRVRAKYLHVNVGHGAISTADIHRRIYVARNVWKRSVIEKRYTRERTQTVPRYVTLRYVSTRFDRAAIVRVDRIYEPDPRRRTVESNSRAKRIGILFKRPARSPLSYPRIDRIFAVYFLSPCRPFFRVAHRIPYRATIRRHHGQDPSESFTSVIFHRLFQSRLPFFHFPPSKKVSIQEYRAYPLADKLVEKLIG